MKPLAIQNTVQPEQSVSYNELFRNELPSGLRVASAMRHARNASEEYFTEITVYVDTAEDVEKAAAIYRGTTRYYGTHQEFVSCRIKINRQKSVIIIYNPIN